MTFDFDKLTDRRNTNSLKYDFALERGRPPEALPLWVADMDFPTAPCVQEALRKSVAHGIFGYSEPQSGYFEALAQWFDSHYGYRPRAEWITKTPGVVFALAASVRTYTRPGDGVAILTPVYYPFYEVIRDNGRKLVESPLRYENGTYSIDFADLEEKIKSQAVKLLLFCSPHNPVGRVWTREELEQLGALAERYDLIVVSDEIHCDFTWPGHPHIPLPAVREDLRRRTVLCTAPTKSFNLAGLQISNIIIEDQTLRRRFREEVARSGYSQVGSMGLVACEAAYRDGGEWLEALKGYLLENLCYLRERVAALPGVYLVEPEGTYLVWMDCSGLGLEPQALEEFVLHKAGLWLDGGALFGPESARFQRLNLACPRATLREALDRLERAVLQDL